MEVLLGVGFGGGDAGERFVEQADDPLLFEERRIRDPKFFKQSIMSSVAE